MAANLVYSKANAFLQELNGNLSNKPIYVGLSTSVPHPSGTNYTEPSSEAGYKRVKLGTSTMSTPANGQTSNVETIYFPEALSSWGECIYFCLFTAQTDTGTTSSLVAYGQLTQSITPTSGQVPLIRAGGLVMTMGVISSGS